MKKLISCSFLFILLLPCRPLTHAQATSRTFQHLTSDKGLSDQNITGIVQDADGFIWIGTSGGLNKFDGYTCKTLSRNENVPGSILSGAINCLFVDTKKRLWVGTENGLFVGNTRNEKFIQYQAEKDKRGSLGNNSVTCITEDEFGCIWVGTRMGLFRFTETNHQFVAYKHDTIGSREYVYHHNRITDLLPDKKGNIWVSTITGLYRFSISRGTFQVAHQLLNRQTLHFEYIKSMTLDRQGKIWMIAQGLGIYNLDPKTQELAFISQTHGCSIPAYTSRIIHDKKNKLWIATQNNGLIVYDPETNDCRNFKHDIFDNKSICENQLTWLFEDKDEMIWIGSNDNGADRISPLEEKFTSYVLQPGKPQSLYEQKITSACEDTAGNLWLGTKNGLMYHDRINQVFTYFLPVNTTPNSLSSHIIHAVKSGPKGLVWVGTEKGLNSYNPGTKKWTRYLSDTANLYSLPANEIYGICAARNGTLWLATSRGPCFKKQGSTNFIHRKNNPAIDRFPRRYYTTVFEDHNQNIWYSTDRGEIFQVDSACNTLRSFLPNSAIGQAVNSFAEDATGNIWMATNNGLYIYSPTTGSVKNINTTNGLSSNIIRAVETGFDGSIWFSKNDGVSRLTYKSARQSSDFIINNFTRSDGLQGNIFNDGASLLLHTGEILFGGAKGFSICNPAKIKFNPAIPPVQITKFKIFDTELNRDEASLLSNTIQLDYNQNFFSFEMAALCYDRPEKNQYAYQLEGFDRKMIYCGTQREVSYTNVPPGSYVLHIMASNSDGVWNKEGFKMKLIVRPHIFQTWWFRTAAIVLFIMLTYLVYRMRIRKLKQEELLKSEITKQVSEARMKALRAQMNPHFIFNSLNSIQQFITSSNKQEALRYLSKFAKLIRLVLQNAEHNINSLEDELVIIQYYLELESLRFANRFTWNFSVNLQMNQNEIEIPAMLLQPYVENAIIHGLLNKSGNGHLELNITQKNNLLICTIEDNGIGREAATGIRNKKHIHHESMGMKVTEERMKMLEQLTRRTATVEVFDLKDANGNATGTRVVIEILITGEQ